MRTAYLILILIGVIVLGVIALWVFTSTPAQQITPTPTPVVSNPKSDLIRVSSPMPNQKITSPILIRGEARGNWYFEASFPVKLVDQNGVILAVAPVQAKGEWMTTYFVPFSIDLGFKVSESTPATLVLEKDNPSGLPEHADEIRIPLILEP